MTQLLVSTPLIGLEQIERAAFTLLVEKLNDALAEMESFMAQSDEDVATLLGRPHTATVLEPIELDNFHEGHRPSLIDAPVDAYPNISVMAVRAVPSPDDAAFDQLSSYRDVLFIEMMARANPDEGEVVVNRRIKRMAEAVNGVLMGDQSLKGVVTGFESAPTLNISDVFTRKERTSYGQHWYWQGGRLEYTVRKEASTPPGGSIFRADSGGSTPDYSQFIDQG